MAMSRRRWANPGIVVLATVLLPAAAGAQQGEEKQPLRLTLREAIQRGLAGNLRVKLADARVAEARGSRERRLAALLPRAQAEVTANVQTRSLAAFGITFPSISGIAFPSEVVGPFATYDFRASFEQPLLDLRAYHRWKASASNEAASRLTWQDTREAVIRQVAALYLSAQVAESRARAAESRIRDAEELLRVACEQRDAGAATGVDVLRAQVQLAHEQQRRLEARNAARLGLLELARALALDMSQPIELAEPLEFLPADTPEISSAVAAALAVRADFHALRSQRAAVESELKANRGRYMPRISVGGNYGGIGRTLASVRGTGIIQGTISVPLFDRDREGDAAELRARDKALEQQTADLRQGIEQEIRAALLALESAGEEVRVAQQGRALAARELELARDRFQAGVTSNMEVVSAQDALARAQENEIIALARHADARLALARALGDTERTYERYISTK
jgi:outer membrane protein TolC